VLDQVGDEVPDLDDPQDLVNLVNASTRCGRRARSSRIHDRSDGGLFAAACEMAFAGHVGVSLNVDLLVTEGMASATAARLRRCQELGLRKLGRAGTN
jgi:phosphoribosylformylglycinamidine synthase